MPSLSEFVSHASHALRNAGLDEPQREARALAAAILGTDRATLLTQSERILNSAEQERLTTALARRSAGVPLARLLGHQEFWGLDFGLNSATLVPRQDSETLIEAALEVFPDQQTPLRVLDLGTGSGCLLLSVLHEYTRATGLGVDLAPDAVTQATTNAATLDLATRTDFVVADWYQDDVCQNILLQYAGANPMKFLQDSGGDAQAEQISPFDLILCNPPYIASTVIPTLQREVREHDPALALDGGTDGLDAYRRITTLLPTLLTQQGTAILEIGYDQGASVPALCRAAGFTTTLRHDLTGQPRCVILKRASTKDT